MQNPSFRARIAFSLCVAACLAQSAIALAPADSKSPSQTFPSPPADSESLDDFSRLGSGRDQLALIEKLYPGPKNLEKRRAALEKTITYFPSDKVTRFFATVQIADIDRQNHKAYEAIERLKSLLKVSPADVGIQLYAFGEYALAMALCDAGRPKEACPIFERLADTPAVTPEEQSWCRFGAALYQEEENPQKAAALLSENLLQHTTAQSKSVALLSELLIKRGETKKLKPLLKGFFEQQFADVDSALMSLRATLLYLRPDEAATLLKTIDDASSGTRAAATVASALKGEHEKIRDLKAYVPLQKALKHFLASSPPLEFQKRTAPDSDEIKPKSHIFALTLQGIYEQSEPAWEQAVINPSDTDRALHYRIDILTKQDPDRTFSANLVYAISIITQQLHREGRTPYEALLKELISLCDRLPETDPNYGTGWIFAGIAAQHRGQHEIARKSFETALSDNLPANWKISAKFGIAESLEALGKIPEALKHYKAAEPTAQHQFSRPEMIRPVLLNLELGNRQEALRILSVVRKLPPTQNYSSQDPCTELVALASEGKAEEYWDSSAKWWPAWQDIEDKLKLPPLDPKSSPFKGDETRDLSSELQTALASYDRDQYFTLIRELAHYARWEPSSAIFLCFEVNRNVPQIAPELTKTFAEFALTLTDNFSSEIPNLSRSAAEIRASSYLKLGMSETALSYIGGFLSHDHIDDNASEAFKRLQGVAALAVGRRSAMTAACVPLKELLGTEKQLGARSSDVYVLDTLYQKLGNDAEEEILLKRELDRPDIQQDNQTYYGQLRSRYQILLNHASSFHAKGTSEPVEQWLAKYRPSWFEFAEPKSLNDPRLSNIEQALNDWNQEADSKKRPSAEAIKLGLLVANDPLQSPRLKEVAFESAFVRLLSLCHTTEDLRKLTLSIVQEFPFSINLRIGCLSHVLIEAAGHQHQDEADYYRMDPLATKLTPALRSGWDAALTYAKTDHSSPAAIEQECRNLFWGTLGPMDIMVCKLYIQDLIRLGEWDRAKKLASDFANCQFGPSAPSPIAVQMELLRTINQKKANAELNRALMDVILKHVPDKPDADKESLLSTVENPAEPRFLKESDAFTVLLQHIRKRQVFSDELTDWSRLMRYALALPNGKQINNELALAMVQNQTSDHQRAAAIETAFGFCDWDDPAERDWIAANLDPYRKDLTHPETYGRVRIFDAYFATKKNPQFDLETALSNLTTPEIERSVRILKLRCYLSTWNLTALKSLIDSLSPDDLVNPWLLPYTLPALDALGMTDEAALARNAAKQQFYRLILESWSHSDFRITPVISMLADVIGNTPLPGEWLKEMAKTQSVEDNLWVRIQQARTAQDWNTVAELSAKAGALPSNENIYFWYQADALHKASRDGDAIQPLKTFIARGPQEYHYAEACRLLKTINASTNSATPAPAASPAIK